jgi:hypothetical protein
MVNIFSALENNISSEYTKECSMKLIRKSRKRSNNRISCGRLLLLVVMVALVRVGPVAADVYYWKDDKGVIHFSNQEQPPPGATLYLVEPPPQEPLPVEPEPESEPELPDQEPEAVEEPEAAEEPEPDASEIEETLEDTRRRLDEIEDQLDDVTGRLEQNLWAAQYAAAAASEARYAAMRAFEAAHDLYAAEWETNRPAAVIAGSGKVAIPLDRNEGRSRRGVHSEQKQLLKHLAEQGPRPTDFDARFRQATDFNERFRQPSAFQKQFIQRP